MWPPTGTAQPGWLSIRCCGAGGALLIWMHGCFDHILAIHDCLIETLPSRMTLSTLPLFNLLQLKNICGLDYRPRAQHASSHASSRPPTRTPPYKVHHDQPLHPRGDARAL
eukprot:364654-Chlamydomonas_euryale.AAC.4